MLSSNGRHDQHIAETLVIALLMKMRTVFSLWLSPSRRTRVSIVLRPSTFLRFHQALVNRKYRLLCSCKSRAKPRPKGPSAELIAAVVEMKRRNPKFEVLKIAQQILYAFAIEAELAGVPSSTPAALDQYGSQQHCRGLFQVPIAA